MAVIKIHLELEELAAVERRAKELGITVEHLAYGALNCAMSHICDKGFCRGEINQAISERGHDLPLWSDSARSIGAYESKGDLPEALGPKGGPLPS